MKNNEFIGGRVGMVVCVRLAVGGVKTAVFGGFWGSKLGKSPGASKTIDQRSRQQNEI